VASPTRQFWDAKALRGRKVTQERRGYDPKTALTLDSIRYHGAPSDRICAGARSAMRCLACGAEMLLMQVSLADTLMAGFERHTFRCSSCSHISRRLVLSHPRSPVTNLPVVAQRERPASKLQMRPATAGSARTKLAEKLRSRATAARGSAPPAIPSTWLEAVEKLRRAQAALNEQAAVASRPDPAVPARLPAASSEPSMPSPAHNAPTASQSAWERAVAKVRARQQGARED
jgi:hypothetical protein